MPSDSGTSFTPEPVSIAGPDGPLSALLTAPAGASACYVLAHGAGAGMDHASMRAVAFDLAGRGIATLRFQFPYMQRGSRRPDPPPVAQAAVRAAVTAAAGLCPGLPLFAGGRSFGGRMTSQAEAAAPLPGVQGLAFLAFPLHPAGRPASERAEHLGRVAIPMLFVQGSRDDLAELELLRPVVAALGPRAVLRIVAEADHSFHVGAKILARSGRTKETLREEVAGALAAFFAEHGGEGAAVRP